MRNGTLLLNLNGKIALIRRGLCPFVLKVKAAQNAGAIGVIMMNNVAGTPVAMGGDDPTITIPSIMISMEDGDALEAAVLAGTVSGPTSTGIWSGGTGAFSANSNLSVLYLSIPCVIVLFFP
jgi:hypothetical protein